MKKKLLFVNGHLNSGGVEKSLFDILNNFDYDNYEVDLVLLEELGDYYNELPNQVNVRIFDLHNTYGNIFSCFMRCIKKRDINSIVVKLAMLMSNYFGLGVLRLLRRIIFRNKTYDCAIAFRPGIVTNLVAFSVKAKKKITWWHHGEFNLSDSQKKEYISSCNKMDAVVSVSKPCAEMLIENISNISDKISVIPNMIDKNSILKKSKEYTPFLKKENEYSLVTVGRLSTEKHIENVIYVASKLKEKNIAFKWYIVGDGSERESLTDITEAYKLNDCIDFVGNKVNPYPYIGNSDLFVHSSYVESQGLAILEAMTLGIPCVVTESRGPSEFIENNKNGILTKQNRESLFESVYMSLTNKELYNTIKRNSKTPDFYNKDNIMRKVYEIIN